MLIYGIGDLPWPFHEMMWLSAVLGRHRRLISRPLLNLKRDFHGIIDKRNHDKMMEGMRSMSFFGRSPSGLAELEEAANERPADPTFQAKLYRALADGGEPDVIIRRFEDERFGRDRECLVHYLCALYETSQLDRAETLLLKSKGASLTEGFTKNSSSPNLSPNLYGQLLLGSKERPLFVQTSGEKSGGWRRLGTAVNVLIIGSILYSLFSMNEQRLEGMTGKVHQLFNPEKTGGLLHTFDDVQGCDEAKQELQDVVEFLKNPEKFNKLGAQMPKGILLVANCFFLIFFPNEIIGWSAWNWKNFTCKGCGWGGTCPLFLR